MISFFIATICQLCIERHHYKYLRSQGQLEQYQFQFWGETLFGVWVTLGFIELFIVPIYLIIQATM